MYDLIIIGAGPAGITASVYAARKRMNFVVITKDIGGQTALSGEIENYTGYQFITGPDLTAEFERHMKKYKVGVKESEEVLGIAKGGSLVSVRTNKGQYAAKAAIIASGKRSRELGVPGEAEFKNRGLTYCATCDGPLFADKEVAVIGGGNSALDAVLQLMNIAKHVFLINITPDITGDSIMKEKAGASDKVTILNNTRVEEVVGNDKNNMAGGIKIKKGAKTETISVQGVFVEIGLIPNSEFVEGIEKNGQGEIKVNSYNKTNVQGIFAAGDVTDVPEKQIIIAAGEGSKAAIGAFRYLSQTK